MSETLKQKVADLERLLVRAALEHAPAALASSLSAEDMVITDAILRHQLDIGIFTLDTGRLHADTLKVIAAIRERYGYKVQVFRPDPAAVAEYVGTFGRRLLRKCRPAQALLPHPKSGAPGASASG
jgi:phosphoadenosine phosphosulfate reductase